MQKEIYIVIRKIKKKVQFKTLSNIKDNYK